MNSDGRGRPMDFYAARDFAYRVGLLADCKLVESASEPRREVVEAAFNQEIVSRCEEALAQIFQPWTRIAEVAEAEIAKAEQATS